MNNKTNTETIPYGVYILDEKYINKLINNSNEPIADPADTIAYIGPVMTISDDRGSVSLFVPVSSEFKEQKVYGNYYMDGIAYGFLDFTKMLPATNDLIQPFTANPALTQFAAPRQKTLNEYALHAAEEYNMSQNKIIS